ncbi:hypothetical protein KAJ27_00870 [bacterium]|nr:hypothetical protein [bacterium]
MSGPIFKGFKYAMSGILGFLLALSLFTYMGLNNIAVIIGAAIGCMCGIIPYAYVNGYKAGQKNQ